MSRTASKLQDYTFEDVLCGIYRADQWKPELINDVLEKLVPSNVRVTVLAQKFKDLATDTEEWYGVKYKMNCIPVAKINEWENVEVPTCFTLPNKNEFIPTDFALVERIPDKTACPHILV